MKSRAKETFNKRNAKLIEYDLTLKETTFLKERIMNTDKKTKIRIQMLKYPFDKKSTSSNAGRFISSQMFEG